MLAQASLLSCLSCMTSEAGVACWCILDTCTAQRFIKACRRIALDV